MVGATKPRTATEQVRIELSKRMIGCLPCLLMGRPGRMADYHHVVEGQRRMGHLHGYPMCDYHHRGEKNLGIKSHEYRAMFGPSYFDERKAFRKFFGGCNGEHTLVMVADLAVSLAENEHWPDLEPPEQVVRWITEYWRKLTGDGHES